MPDRCKSVQRCSDSMLCIALRPVWLNVCGSLMKHGGMDCHFSSYITCPSLSPKNKKNHTTHTIHNSHASTTMCTQTALALIISFASAARSTSPRRQLLPHSTPLLIKAENNSASPHTKPANTACQPVSRVRQENKTQHQPKQKKKTSLKYGEKPAVKKIM